MHRTSLTPSTLPQVGLVLPPVGGAFDPSSITRMAAAAELFAHADGIAILHINRYHRVGEWQAQPACRTDAHLAALPDWLSRPDCVAVGECGLDFFVPGLDVGRQQAIFIEHIRLSAALGKPLIIHARKATERVIQLLKQQGPATGVIHSYSGSLEQARILVDMGFMLGIGGPLTYPRSTRLRAIVQEIPLQYLLLETDSPDQPMHGEQGRRNEPEKLIRVAEAVAEAKSISVAEVADQTRRNAECLFGLDA